MHEMCVWAWSVRACVRVCGGHGADFTNILRAAFAHADLKSTKGHWWLNCLFALLGFSHVKAFHKTLMKLTHDVYVISRKRLKRPWAISFLAF